MALPSGVIAVLVSCFAGCAVAQLSSQNCSSSATQCNYACPIRTSGPPGFCEQECTTSNCSMNCESTGDQCVQSCSRSCSMLTCEGESCQQTCNGNCKELTCNTTTACTSTCSNCEKITCTSNICAVTVGGSAVKGYCHSSNRCEMVCSSGDCELRSHFKEAATTALCTNGRCTLYCVKGTDPSKCSCLSNSATCRVEYYGGAANAGSLTTATVALVSVLSLLAVC